MTSTLTSTLPPSPPSAWALWRDNRGRLSALRIAALAFLMLPIALAVAAAFTEDRFGARPLNDLIHRAGYWALVFTLSSLAITPLRRIARLNQLLDVRRLIGVGAFCYAAAHITLYIADQMFDLLKVGSEIVLRVYLTVGFSALLGLLALAATSTDRMVQQLGASRWQRLHQLIYVIGFLGLIHFFQQTKLDVWVPTVVAGLFTWLVGYRLLTRWWGRKSEPPTWALLGLALAASVLTFLGEAIGIAIGYSVSPLMILAMAFDFDLDTIRPGWVVFAAGLAIVLVDLVRSRWRKGRPATKIKAAAARPAGQARETA
jgi:sulfoxide reductase heme-binding subunit YedZ